MNEFKYIQKLISQKSPKAEILVACSRYYHGCFEKYTHEISESGRSIE